MNVVTQALEQLEVPPKRVAPDESPPGRAPSRASPGASPRSEAESFRSRSTSSPRSDQTSPRVWPRKSAPVSDRMPVDDRAEKQAALLELQALARDGVQLTRSFSMEDSASDMMFELNRIRSSFDTHSAVGMMTDGLQLGMKCVEMANARWGPVLHLDGWSTTVDHDRERFKRVLAKLYKKHWRRGAMMSPEAELALLLGGSAAMHHFQYKMGANPASNKSGIFGSFGNIMNMFGQTSAPPARSSGGDAGAGESSFSQRPPMRRPNTQVHVTEPSPDPLHTAKLNEQINSLREERANLQAQLHHQTGAGFGSFVVLTEDVSKNYRIPHIEVLS